MAAKPEAKPIFYERNPVDSLWYPIENDKNVIINILPPNTQKVLSSMGEDLKVTPSGNIIYPDNTVGSSLVEMGAWLQKPKSAEKPIDGEKFKSLIPPSKWIKLYDNLK